MINAQTAEIFGGHIRPFDPYQLRKVDLLLVTLVLVLGAVGLATLVSADRSAAVQTPYYMKQLLFLCAGILIAAGIACFDHRFLVSFGPLAYVVVVALLIAVHFFGYSAKGAQRWLDLGLFGLQPSEQSKLALIFMLAWYFNKIGEKIRKLPYFLLTFAIAAVPALLILKQPNLGTAAILGPITFAMLFMAGCKMRHFIAVIIGGIAAMPVAWSQLEGYQKERVMSFLNPASDPMGSGYHTIQSMITVGSGGLTGQGYMQGSQTFLSYLPEHHTDFIFSLLAEEWGFMGATTVIAIFCVMLLRGLSYAQQSKDLSGSLLAVGIVTMLAFHTFVNIAITVGLMPVTGIPLPFLSYGGSFYLTTMLSIGVLLSVCTRKKRYG